MSVFYCEDFPAWQSAWADRLYLLQVMSKELLFLTVGTAEGTEKFWILQCRKIKCIGDFFRLVKKYPKINLILLNC